MRDLEADYGAALRGETGDPALDTEVYWNYHTGRYHTSKACAGDDDHVIKGLVGGIRGMGGALACTRCGADKIPR